MAKGDGRSSFDEFDARLEKARGGGKAAPEPTGTVSLGRTKFGAGLQVGIELVAGVAFGALLGYGLDRWLGTAPFLLITCFMLGAAAGTLNAYRWLSRFTAAPND